MPPHNDKRLIMPADALVPVHIRLRNAPKPRVSGRLEGHVHWGLIDRRGREVRGGDQSNLILDQGLDLVASYNLAASAGLRNYAVVGTGSTAPDEADTSLVSELARSNTTSASSTTTPTAGRADYSVTKEFGYAQANGNLTEFGFAPTASGNLAIRELFRDGSGNAITITKTSDYLLRITHVFEVEITPAATWAAASFDIAGIGTVHGEHGFMTQALSALRYWSLAAQESTTRAMHATSRMSYATTSNSVSSSGTVVAPADAYVPGSHERQMGDTLWTVTDGNATWKAFQVGQSGTSRGWAWAFNIDALDEFTKDNEHVLTISDILKLTWGRA